MCVLIYIKSWTCSYKQIKLNVFSHMYMSTYEVLPHSLLNLTINIKQLKESACLIDSDNLFSRHKYEH